MDSAQRLRARARRTARNASAYSWGPAVPECCKANSLIGPAHPPTRRFLPRRFVTENFNFNKTLTGQELQLDDGPARDSELFLVDGNNLAYRAFFALPEELATTDGFPTNALLGFTNMLFKLLADYKDRKSVV